ncbi:hypothetical protein Q2T94_16965 [Paeniglutamicibacter sulfureus]|uniref:hypothetical protein n=1 Tax=Paeniglutamicibacter sulfureus TaxID=43666 RepID=UPI002665B4B6|nr:hypothetical protein [Paeniglutamicibacter sulfureus]MDO2935993.1 hypothetical protein [Paeniglutamicibacter sulfureus]
MNFPLFPRGFVYSKHFVKLPDDVAHFARRDTSMGTFWFAPDLHHEVLEAEDLTVVLFGHAHYVTFDTSDNDLLNITRRIATAWMESGSAGVEGTLYDLAGRYGLFIRSTSGCYVYQDAHGMRSIYHNTEATVLSSHERLLADITGARRATSRLSELPLSIRWSHSKYAGIRSLIPNHRLQLETGTSERFFGHEANPHHGLSNEQRVDMVHQLWSEQLRALARNHKIALSITGGLDSRTSLAIARPHWDSLHTFTYTTAPDEGNGWAKSLHKDDVIVRQILDVVNVKHTLLDRGNATPVDRGQQDIMNRNSAGLHGQWLLNLYRKHISGPDVVHLRGNLNETARNYYHDFVDLSTPLEGVRQMMRSQVRVKRPALVAAIDEILEELEKEVVEVQLDRIDPSYEILDFYYWEIRMGRWFSEVFNETDAAFETFIPFNHRRIIDIALSFTGQERLDGVLFRELINKNAPFLNFFGVNETPNLYEQYLRTVPSAPVPNRSVLPLQTISLSDRQGVLIKSVPFDGLLYIPEEFLKLGNEASVEYPLVQFMGSKLRADIKIQIDNSYSSPNGQRYLELIVELDGRDIAKHDLAHWPEPFAISITNVTADSKIRVRIRSLRDSPKKSWETASKTKIEISAVNNFDPGRRILTDNPYASLTNE